MGDSYASRDRFWRHIGIRQKPQMGDRIDQPEKVSRFEVIGPNGREMSISNVTIELHYQDDGRTLKIFHCCREKR